MRERRGDEPSAHAFEEGTASLFLRERTEGREQIAVGDTARARGFAGEATEAAVHMRQRVGERERAFEHLLHEHDAAARRVHLLAEFAVRRARGEAESAMHARLDGARHGRSKRAVGFGLDRVKQDAGTSAIF